MKLLATGMLIAIVLPVASCDLPGSTSRSGGTLTVAISADPTSLNRFLAADPASLKASAPLFPNLYQANPDLSISPDLAESMPTLSADRKSWTVKLRRDARWSDGAPITADDVLATVNIQRNPGLVTDVAFDWSMLASLDRVDDHTVRFNLSEVYAPFLANSLTTFVAPGHIYGAVDVAKMAADPISQEPAVTGGPFRFEKRNNSEVDLVANPDYYAGRPQLDRMVLKIVPDASAAATAVANGAIGWEPDLAPAALDQLKGTPEVAVYQYPALSFYDVRFNDRPDHLFGDKRVRQAFAFTIDKEAIVRKVTGGHGVALWGDIAPESWAYDPVAVVRYKPDLARARQLMLEAGWQAAPGGVAVKGGKPFSTSFFVRNDTPSRQAAVEMISAQAREIGMDLRPAPVSYYNPADKTSFFDPLKKGTYDIAFVGFASSPDPDQFRIFHSSQLRPEHSPTGVNWTGYSSPELDRLIEQERSTVLASDADTRAARRRVLSKIERVLGEDVVTYFMWADNNAQAFSSRVGGLGLGNQGSLINLDSGLNVQAFARWRLR